MEKLGRAFKRQAGFAEQESVEVRVGRVLRKDEASVVTLPLENRRSGDQQAIPTIRVVAGADMLRFHSIVPHERVVIGRDGSCNLRLTDASVSRWHAAVTALGSVLVLEDLGSTNGTTYQGSRVHGSRAIEVGEEICVGSVTLRVEFLAASELTHLAQVIERLNRADKDALTGLLSRQHLQEVLPDQIRRYHKADIPLAAVFVDVDHFKRVNDTLGHAVGDEVLRTVSRIMALEIRDTDSAIRYGGEEFVLILPNCDERGGGIIGDRIRTLINRHDWSAHIPGDTSGEVTVSVGVAQYQGGLVGNWISHADQAMYRAKRKGRNRTCLASET